MAKDLKVIKDPVTGKSRLSLLNGNLETVTGREECAQRIETALKKILGEWFLDLSEGLPTFDQIFRRQQYNSLVINYYRQAISGVSGVKAIQSLILERGDARDYQLRYAAVYEDNTIITGEI